MKRIYTKTGDKGMTRIRGGVCLPKDDIVIETNGTLDELNAVLGIVRSLLSADHPWQESLEAVQQELLVVMSHLATPPGHVNPKPLRAGELTVYLEGKMDEMLATQAPTGFVLPGGSPVAAQLHFARTVARRAERCLCRLQRNWPVAEEIVCLINRLSDWLFVLAREA